MVSLDYFTAMYKVYRGRDDASAVLGAMRGQRSSGKLGTQDSITFVGTTDLFLSTWIYENHPLQSLGPKPHKKLKKHSHLIGLLQVGLAIFLLVFVEGQRALPHSMHTWF